MKIYTKKGDDGTTGLLFGGRVRKDSAAVEVNGAVDEAQAALGVARAGAERGSELDELLVALERDLWVLMAEVATARSNRRKLVPGVSLVTPAMVSALEVRIDDLEQRFGMPTEFVVPGGSPVSAALDLARTVVRRAERLAIGLDLGLDLGGPEPGGPDPGGVHAGDFDPGDPQPGDADHVAKGTDDPDLGDPDPGDADPGDPDPGDADPGDADAGDADPGDAEVSETSRSEVVPYLNRLSDLCWMLARWQEGEHLLARGAGKRARS